MNICKKTGILALTLLVAGGSLAACGNHVASKPESLTSESKAPLSASADVFAMDTYMTITCYGEKCQEAVDASVEEIQRLDQLLSVGDSNSDVFRLNHERQAILADDTAKIVEEALDLYSKTDGVFDISIYPLMELWGFTSGNYQVPDQDQLEEILQHVDAGQLSYDPETKHMDLNTTQGIDLGGIAKGYTSDRLMEIFQEYNLTAGLVSLGGNVECYGKKPNGEYWKCGIQDPLRADDRTCVLGAVSVADEAVITSGGYERYFAVAEDGTVIGEYENQRIQDQEGQIFHHIIDPQTGYPAQTGILSVTIISENGMLADGLSTTCYLMGLDDAIDYWRDHSEEFDFVIMTEDQEVYATESISQRFQTDYPLHCVSREGISDE